MEQMRSTLFMVVLYTLLGRICFTGGHQLTGEDKDKIVGLHNRLRSQVKPTAADMQSLSWNATLESVAKDHAARCIWDHNPELTDIGENLYITNGDLDVSKALTNWYIEHNYYTYKNNSCVEERVCGHYTQVVWAMTTMIGCASYFCEEVTGFSSSKAIIMVCNYFPSGNYEGQMPYQEGEPCSQCPESMPACESNICVSYKDHETWTTEDPHPGSNTPFWPSIDLSTESPLTVEAQTRIYLEKETYASGADVTAAWSAALFIITLLSIVQCLDSTA